MKNIKDIIVRVLFEHRISEMVIKRKQLIDKIINMKDIINIHLFYLIVYPNSINISHRKKELTNWLYDLGNEEIKPNSKKLDKDSYYETFISNFDSKTYLPKLAKNALEDEGNFEYYTLKTLDYNEIINKYKSFYSKLSKYFSENDIDRTEVKNYINQF
jgi:hypothetical protein